MQDTQAEQVQFTVFTTKTKRQGNNKSKHMRQAETLDKIRRQSNKWQGENADFNIQTHEDNKGHRWTTLGWSKHLQQAGKPETGSDQN